jgi:hypothetical protein
MIRGNAPIGVPRGLDGAAGQSLANTESLEPEVDPPGEDPWSDLWFYSNPIFIEVR